MFICIVYYIVYSSTCPYMRKRTIVSVFLLILLFSSIAPAVSAQNKFSGVVIDTAVKNMILKHQVLLTNKAVFKAHKDEMMGASSFLINYNSKVFAVTAKHVLGEAMGVEPEVLPRELNKYLLSWKMFPRVAINPKTDTVKVSGGSLNYNSLDRDILLLEVINTKFSILPLTPDFNLPKKGDKLYIIGCPYSQEKCRQNIYPITFDSYEEETSMLNCIITTKFELAGFSGAPIVNANGKVVGILTSGWEQGQVKFVGGTFINEIQKVK